MTYVAIWPVLDDSRTMAQLVAEAGEDLSWMLAEADLIADGPVDWQTAEHGDVLYLSAAVPVREWSDPVLCAARREVLDEALRARERKAVAA